MLVRLREPISGLTHLAAAVAAAIGLVALLYIGRGSSTKALSLLIYGASLVLMFAASAAYHLVDATPEKIRRLRQIDHAAIYLLIAGTYTPVCLGFFSGFWCWGMLSIVWTMAIVGIGVKIFVIAAPRWVTAGIYLLMGWLALMAIESMLESMPVAALAWLVAGGLCFTVGAVVYITKKPDLYPGVFGFHEVWHIFVILGCVCHFVVIAAFVAPY